jgi:hypothetical protein
VGNGEVGSEGDGRWTRQRGGEGAKQSSVIDKTSGNKKEKINQL